MQRKVIGHRDLPHVVITRRHTARQIVEETEDSRVFIVNGKEVVIRDYRTSATVKHPFPTIFGGEAFRKLIGQVGQLFAFVPGQVYKRIGVGIFSIFVINLRLTVPDVNSSLIAPVVAREVFIVYVVVTDGRSSSVGGKVPVLNHARHCVASTF